MISIKQAFTDKFSHNWVQAWNSHDLNKIMTHYTDDFEMSSPVIRKIMNIKSGKIKGKIEVRTYWEKALSINPDFHFENLLNQLI